MHPDSDSLPRLPDLSGLAERLRAAQDALRESVG